MSLLCSEPSVAVSSLREKTQVLPMAHKALHPLSHPLPAFTFPHSPHSLTQLQPCGPPHCSLNTPVTIQPQGLCMSCSLHQVSIWLLICFGSLLKCPSTLSLPHPSPDNSHSPFSILFPSTPLMGSCQTTFIFYLGYHSSLPQEYQTHENGDFCLFVSLLCSRA